MTLETGSSSVIVRPAEGASATDLIVRGSRILARTPWHQSVRVSPAPARDEAEWVGRWRGGWQLCFPTSGVADPDAFDTQGFHGAASQAPWQLLSLTADAARLHWRDASALEAERTWRLLEDGLAVTTVATNRGDHRRAVAIAEHLILGADVIAPIFNGEALQMHVDPSTQLAPLDYAGAPDGAVTSWPGAPSEAWDRIDAATPARVAALLVHDPAAVRVIGPDVVVTVRWSGLSHALLWEELAQSEDFPWHGQVTAVGIEPTSTPHGLGTRGGIGLLEMPPGAEIEWTVRLRVDDRDRQEKGL